MSCTIYYEYSTSEPAKTACEMLIARRKFRGQVVTEPNDVLDWKSTSFLIIDDERMIRELVIGLLRNLGAREIAQARSAEHAISVLEDLTPDCIIVDVTMTPLNGIDFALMVRSAELNTPYDTPIVFLTGHSQVSLVAAAGALDANEFILKPVSRIALAMRLRRAIRAKGCKHPPGSYAARLAAARGITPRTKEAASSAFVAPLDEKEDDSWFRVLSA